MAYLLCRPCGHVLGAHLRVFHGIARHPAMDVATQLWNCGHPPTIGPCGTDSHGFFAWGEAMIPTATASCLAGCANWPHNFTIYVSSRVHIVHVTICL